MKKIIIAAMALTCATAVFSADTVTSENIVGYNKAVTTTGLQILGTAFLTGNDTPPGVFGDSLPVGSKIFAYNGAGYDSSEFKAGFGGVTFWDNETLNIGQAVGYWVDVPSGTQTNIISGDVETVDNVTNSITVGLQLLSYPYPVARTVPELGFTPSVGDKIFVYNGTGYDSSEFKAGFGGVTFWDNTTLTIEVGVGFWYDSVGSTNWVVARPFTP